MKNIREPAVAGMFYPASGNKLAELINWLLESSKPVENYSQAAGIVSPHAGYEYSGRTAASAFNSIAQKKIDTAIIISPSHREYFPGISVYNGDAYKTPLGLLPVNKEIRELLVANSKIIFEGIQGHRTEHAVEVQIPFLQVTHGNISIVPVVMGDQGRIFVNELAEKISGILDDSILVIASSDLSHFYDRERASRLDSIVEQRISNFEFEELQSDLETGRCEACGGGAIVALLKAAHIAGKKKSKVLSRTDSGDVTGDLSEVVGYLSAVVY